MRIEINLPVEDGKFNRKLETLVKQSNRPSRKNFLETLILRHVDVAKIKSPSKSKNGKVHLKTGRR